ncbi:MAG: hypothetical protein NZM31_11890 [Gemmatales bacterium]|nr:hypothetical protein [Gemmatales bacterium]MDW8387696.1 hypothetical protein [Gemmatales bacterium]
MFEFAIPCVCFLLFIGLAVAVVIYGNYVSEKRRKALAEAAQLMGFDWLDKTLGTLSSLFRHFTLFNRGSGADAYNAMRGRIGSQELYVMDCKYTTGSGKNRSTHYQTVVLLPEAATHLPVFEMEPENFLHQVFQVFGYQDIDFEEHPEFSRKYLLRGPNAEQIREAFTPEALDYFGSQPGWFVESKNGSLLVYRHGVVVTPEKLPEFVAEAARIAAFFQGGSGPSGKPQAIQEEF